MNNIPEVIWLILLFAAPALWLLIRHALKVFVEKAVQTAYDKRIETFRSELRAREASLVSMQNSLLAERSGRQAELSKKRLAALEAVWNEVIRLRPAGMAVMSMQLLDINLVAKRIPNEPNLKEVVDMMRGKGTMELFADNSIDQHQPFASEPVWANFIAYKTIIVSAVSVLEFLTIGIDEPMRFFSVTHATNLVKAVLPHRSDYLEKAGFKGVFHLTEELEKLILASIRRNLDGQEADENAVAQARRIIDLAHEVSKNAEAAKFGSALPS